MFLKFVLLGIALTIIICLSNMLLTKIKLKYRLYKELKIKKQREKAFRESISKIRGKLLKIKENVNELKITTLL